MKKIFIILIFIVLASCKTEEDKYPEMEVFKPEMKGDFIFKETKPIARYLDYTNDYVFFSNKNEIFIYNKQSKKLIKTLNILNTGVSIDEKSCIFNFNNETEKAFKYIPPNFKKVNLEKISLEYVSNKNLEKKYLSEIKKEKLEGSNLSNFLNKKRYGILKKDFIDSLICIKKLHKRNTAIAYFKDKEAYIESCNYLFNGTFIKSKLKGVEECEYIKSNHLLETNYFGENPLTLFDAVTLDYYFSGSNHFAIGVGSKELYYYELMLNGKTLKFKYPYRIKNIVNLEGLIVIQVQDKYYKVSIKKG